MPTPSVSADNPASTPASPAERIAAILCGLLPPGAELAVLTDYGEVIGPWSVDPAVHGGKRCFWARTLTAEEAAGVVAAEERAAEHRFARLAIYRRAAFGLASAAECASLAAANGGDKQWGLVRLGAE